MVNGCMARLLETMSVVTRGGVDPVRSFLRTFGTVKVLSGCFCEVSV
jgi:hypothetical protein